MNTYGFTIQLDRAPGGEGQDWLDEAGLDGSSLELAADGQAWPAITREAGSPEEAILSAIAGIRQAGYGAVGIWNDGFVSVADTARRTGWTPEPVRLLTSGITSGEREGSDFPPPVTDGLYSWAQVRAWFADRDGISPAYDHESDTLAVTDLLLRAMTLRPHAGRLAELVTA
jgi:hypothetical protein